MDVGVIMYKRAKPSRQANSTGCTIQSNQIGRPNSCRRSVVYEKSVDETIVVEPNYARSGCKPRPMSSFWILTENIAGSSSVTLKHHSN